MDEAIFNSAHDALQFAYKFVGQVPESTLGKQMRKKAEEDGTAINVGTGKGLAGLDGAAQAGMILSTVNRLEFVAMYAVQARYAVRTSPCHCCGLNAMTSEYKDALRALSEFTINTLGEAKVDFHLRVEFVIGHFGKRANIMKLAKKFDLSRNTVADYQNKVVKQLKKLEFDAQNELHELFVANGVIEAPEMMLAS